MNDKMSIIADILRNDIYAPESGMYNNLVKALACLSTSDLINLRLIITLRMVDSVNLAREVDAILSK